MTPGSLVSAQSPDLTHGAARSQEHAFVALLC